MKVSSVCLSVPSFARSLQAAAARLLLGSSRAGDIDRLRRLSAQQQRRRSMEHNSKCEQ